MADPRVQQARRYVEIGAGIRQCDAKAVLAEHDRLADRVAALETALRFVRPEFAQADNVESWHWGHVKRGEPYAEDCGLCIIDAALVGSGTEPAPAEGGDRSPNDCAVHGPFDSDVCPSCKGDDRDE